MEEAKFDEQPSVLQKLQVSYSIAIDSCSQEAHSAVDV